MIGRPGTTRRRLTFQLTPLLDLLLIVIFAQYLEVQSASRAETARAAEAAERVTELERNLKRLSEVRDREDLLQQELAEARRRQHQLAERFAEVFRINEDAIAAMLDADAPSIAGLTDEEREELRERFRRLVRSRGAAALEHLVTYEELRKRADVWQVRVGTVAEAGKTTLQAGERTTVIRADSADRFADRVFAIYKDLPQPKDHVVILLTYDSRQAELASLNVVRRGLPRAVNRMQADGTSKFFWAEIGYDPSILGLPE